MYALQTTFKKVYFARITFEAIFLYVTQTIAQTYSKDQLDQSGKVDRGVNFGKHQENVQKRFLRSSQGFLIVDIIHSHTLQGDGGGGKLRK